VQKRLSSWANTARGMAAASLIAGALGPWWGAQASAAPATAQPTPATTWAMSERAGKARLRLSSHGTHHSGLFSSRYEFHAEAINAETGRPAVGVSLQFKILVSGNMRDARWADMCSAVTDESGKGSCEKRGDGILDFFGGTPQFMAVAEGNEHYKGTEVRGYLD
jgi:hypothetical protein